ncbi:MAG: hypothetical protein H7836_04680 [Magnetococcus sp. YQC-3]
MMGSGLFSELFGKKDKSVPVDALISRIDIAIDKLNIKSDSDNSTEDNLITKSISDMMMPNQGANPSEDLNDSEKDILGKFSSGLDPLFKDFKLPEGRNQKYKTYDQIYDSVQLIKMVVSVYLDNIFQKDSITNKVFLIKETNTGKAVGQTDEYKRFAEKFINFFNLDEKMKNLMFKSLKYGDAYIEYINLDNIPDNFPVVKKSEVENRSKNNPNNMEEILNTRYISESMVLENILTSVESKARSSNNKGKLILDELEVDKLSDMIFEYDENTKTKLEDDSVFIYEAPTVIFNEKENINNKSQPDNNKTQLLNRIQQNTNSAAQKNKKNNEKNLNGILLRYHNPQNIVPIVSHYDTLLGYVEIKDALKSQQAFNPVLGFLDIVKKVSSTGTGSYNENYDKTLKIFAQNIAKKIIIKYNIFQDDNTQNNSSINRLKLEKEYQSKIKSNLDEELYYSLKRILLESGNLNLFNKKLSVRFIPVDRMFRFPISSSGNYPHGESIIDPLVYPAKLYLLTQLSNIVTKLSRSSINTIVALYSNIYCKSF